MRCSNWRISGTRSSLRRPSRPFGSVRPGHLLSRWWWFHCCKDILPQLSQSDYSCELEYVAKKTSSVQLPPPSILSTQSAESCCGRNMNARRRGVVPTRPGGGGEGVSRARGGGAGAAVRARWARPDRPRLLGEAVCRSGRCCHSNNDLALSLLWCADDIVSKQHANQWQ